MNNEASDGEGMHIRSVSLDQAVLLRPAFHDHMLTSSLRVSSLTRPESR